jgi:hypothetical protein
MEFFRMGGFCRRVREEMLFQSRDAQRQPASRGCLKIAHFRTRPPNPGALPRESGPNWLALRAY